MEEQRRHARVPCNLQVTCEGEGFPQATGRARDISVAGVFIEAEAQPEFGTSVIVTVQLPGIDEVSTVKGVVRWSKVDGFGVQFGEVGVKETHALTNIMRRSI